MGYHADQAMIEEWSSSDRNTIGIALIIIYMLVKELTALLTRKGKNGSNPAAGLMSKAEWEMILRDEVRDPILKELRDIHQTGNGSPR